MSTPNAVISLFICLAGAAATAQTLPPDTFPSQIQVERLNGSLSAVAPTLSPRRLTPVAVELIKDFESWSPTAYNDTAGYCTIGFGHLLALKKCEDISLGIYSHPVSKSQGEKILEQDTAIARLVVQQRLHASLSDDQFGALTSFVFNVGERNFSRSELLKLASLGKYDVAVKEFKNWNEAKGHVLDGLVVRRKCEATLFSSKLRLNESGTFSRDLCIDMGIGSGGGHNIDIYQGEN